MVSLLAVKLRRDIRRQWLQFGAVALTLALGVAVFGAAYDSYDNLKSSYREIYDRLDFADVTITGGDASAVTSGARTLDGVAATATRRQSDVPFRIDAAAGEYTLLGRIVGPTTGDSIDRILLDRGTGLDPAAPFDVVVERHTADHFHLEVGDTVDVFGGGRWRQVRIAGVAVSPEYLWPARSRQDLLGSLDDFGVLFGTEALIDAVSGDAANHQALVRYDPGADRATLDGQVRDLAVANDAGDVMTRADQPSYDALEQDVQAFGQLAVLFPLLFLVAGSLAAYVLLGRLVRAQRGEIGMLVANGYPQRRLLRHYVGFGAAAGIVGSGVGAAGGLGLAVLLTHSYTNALSIPLAVSHFHPVTPLVGVVVGTLAASAAATAPARAATRVTPAEAMGGVAPIGVGHRSPLERVPGIRGLPVRVRLAMRNVQRSPRRAVSTGIGVALAGVLVLSSLGMLDTMSVIIDEQFHTVERQDATLYLDAAPNSGQRASVAAVAGVAAVEPSLDVPVVLTAGSKRYQTLLTGFEPETTMHHFPDGVPSSGVVLGSALRGVLDVGVGDTVEVAVGDAAPVAVPVAGFVSEPVGSLAYSTIDTAEQLAGSSGQHSLLVQFGGGVDREEMRARLSGQPGAIAYRDIRGSEEAVRSMFELFYAIIGVMLLFGAILAFVVLFNTLSVNLSERTVELATLRAAGGRLTTLARLVTGENVLLVTVVIPVGLVAGWATAVWFMSAFNTDLWNLSARFHATTPVLVAAAMLAVTLLMHVPTRRYLRHLDVARVVRERAL